MMKTPCALPIGSGWKYRPGGTYRPAREIVHLLAEVAAKGGDLLAGIGPTPAGTLEDEALRRLREVGEWLDVNGEAIYGTRRGDPFVQDNIWFTRRKDVCTPEP